VLGAFLRVTGVAVSRRGDREVVEPGNRSLWIETTPDTAYPALEGDIEIDVAVVGAGISGVMTAWFLKREGLRVALVEMGRVGEGATGYTTAKLTLGHNVIYADLVRKHGEGTARAYADSNQWAIERLEELVVEHGIDCDWERAANYVYTEDEERLSDLRDELEAMRRVGIAAELTGETDLPFPIMGAVRVEEQAQFHPRRFLQGLADKIPGEDSHVFEQTLATDVRSSDECTVVTERGTIRAAHVVLATQLPFLDRGLFFAKAHPQKSYAIAAQMQESQAPLGMYISADQPTRSIRSAPGPEGSRFLLIGGEGHKPGRDDNTRQRYEALEGFLSDRFEAREVEHRWSTHDYVPLDRLPYIGRLRRTNERILVATGFAKWGLTKGMVAAAILTDTILGRDNSWAAVYDSKRLSLKNSAPKFVAENAKVGARFVGDRVRPRDGRDGIDSLRAGDGTVARISGRHLAVYRDDDGELHVLSARCTHLGCIVGWNRADRTWECSCHGSRFGADGALLQGPATEPLPPRELPRGRRNDKQAT
jgi:glycine/D-amino acid oxidase-like deaminating enzyme/nitrite reductase/ring-hydroxylating ferredoxin subunit